MRRLTSENKERKYKNGENFNQSVQIFTGCGRNEESCNFCFKDLINSVGSDH